MSHRSNQIALCMVSILVLLGLVLAGCAPKTSSVPVATQPPVASQAPELTQPPAIEPPAATTQVEPPPVVGESSITILIAEDPPSFNAVVGDTGYDGLVMNLVLLGLTGIDPDGKVYPELAAELPTIDNGGVVVNQEAGTMDVTWKMRNDITWADGKPVTAADAIFTWEAINNPETGTWVRGRDYVDSIEKVDDYTFTFHYNAIYPGYLIQLGGDQLAIWPAHYCDPKQGFVAWDCGRKPLSDGPYMLEEWLVGDHLSFVRNPKYYENGKPYIDKIIVKIVPDESVRKTMMIQGDADIDMWTTEPLIYEFKKHDNIRVSMNDASRWVMRLFPNQAAKGTTDPKATPNPVFSDVRVRRAIRMAIDIDTISKELWYGYAKPVWTEFYRKPYACNITRPAYDPEGAKTLLEQAGWKDTNGDGVRECRGCTTGAKEGDLMKIEFYTYAEYGQMLQQTHQYIAEELKKIGIESQLTVFEGSVLWADPQSGGIEQNGDFGLDLWDDGYSGNDPTDYLWELYYSKAATPGNGWNIVRWMSPEFDALLDQTYTLDEGVRKDLFCQMAQMLEDQLPVILLFSAVNADSYSIRLEGVQSNINDLVSWNAANWKIVK
jgi:peptide/nickel transport system substrate-binding protein